MLFLELISVFTQLALSFWRPVSQLSVFRQLSSRKWRGSGTEQQTTQFRGTRLADLADSADMADFWPIREADFFAVCLSYG